MTRENMRTLACVTFHGACGLIISCVWWACG